MPQYYLYNVRPSRGLLGRLRPSEPTVSSSGNISHLNTVWWVCWTFCPLFVLTLWHTHNWTSTSDMLAACKVTVQLAAICWDWRDANSGSISMLAKQMIMKYKLVAGWWHHQYLNCFPFHLSRCRRICHWAQHFSGDWMSEWSFCAFILWCCGFLIFPHLYFRMYSINCVVRVTVYQTQLVSL